MKALWVIDVQERLMPHVDRAAEVLDAMCFFLRAACVLELPLFVSEQYPAGLGSTVPALKQLLPPAQQIYEKTTFSGCADQRIGDAVASYDVREWVLMGIEAHICVLQTARDLKEMGHKVCVLSDAISSRSLYDFSTAIGELRDLGIRVTSTETLLYEMLEDAATPEFKTLLPLLKEKAHV